MNEHARRESLSLAFAASPVRVSTTLLGVIALAGTIGVLAGGAVLMFAIPVVSLGAALAVGAEHPRR
jgi:hypothetical protein